jgi:alpha,alpha-trehalose phosphorylase
LTFRMQFRSRIIEVDVRRVADASARDNERAEAIAPGEQRVTYRLLEGEPIRTSHHGEPLELRPGDPVTLDVPALPRPAPVTQPRSRTPAVGTCAAPAPSYRVHPTDHRAST